MAVVAAIAAPFLLLPPLPFSDVAAAFFCPAPAAAAVVSVTAVAVAVAGTVTAASVQRSAAAAPPPDEAAAMARRRGLHDSPRNCLFILQPEPAIKSGRSLKSSKKQTLVMFKGCNCSSGVMFLFSL